jgi:chloramphenicol-sensitive protein RarD
MNQAAPIPETRQQNDGRAGLLFGLGAYGLWGVLPIYFKLVGTLPATAIVAHRILWSMPFLAILSALTGGGARMRRVLADRRALGTLALTTLLIGGNWLLYVYAVTNGHILAASFGYYLNPIANVLLGRFALKERLSRLQWGAIAIAVAGIAVLAAGAIAQLWISLALCGSFALYGLLRKVVPADPLSGMAIETGFMLPLALAWAGWHLATGQQVMGSSPAQTGLLLLAGLVSTTPLLLFTAAARRLPYSTLGMIQFIAPTLQFLIAVLLYGEPFTLAHAAAFAAIWTALGLYVTALVRGPGLGSSPQSAQPCLPE